ncbi:cobalamin-binding protein [Paenibacillus xerothermodurans]|uniref:Cobalamin-binding protein n=2 Tax=Paenibacillus xerothermodurans TaxID=1977292 RepID=A0A2W1N701_PAEXE|nr:helical backbone metal receptor [Paenibacillus xerothermodurans]PZE20379.1 cobalamin-binding protein [Paenibacillus xerothermodurans]
MRRTSVSRLLGKKKWLGALLGLAVAFGAAGCGNSADKQMLQGEVEPPKARSATEQVGQAGAQGELQTAKSTVYPLKISDSTGKEFTFEKAPERIVSVSPSETEILFALGLGDRVIGVSDFCDYPAEAAAKPKMGSIVKPNEEALLAANADVILSGVSLNMPAVEHLRELKLSVFKVEPKTMDDVMNNILMFGQIFDKQEQAENIVGSMKADRQKVTDAVKQLTPEQRKRVFVEFAPGWTVGKGEYIDELVTLAGGVNIAADTEGYAQFNEEQVIAANPQVILYPHNLVDDSSKKTMDQIIRERSGWAQIDAIKNNRLVGLDTNIISRPGPRLGEALVAVAKGLYPALVK